MKDKKELYCEKCKEITEHIPTHFRKIFEKQHYRCLVCDEEREE